MDFQGLAKYPSKIAEKGCEFCRIPSLEVPLFVSRALSVHQQTWSESEGYLDSPDLLKCASSFPFRLRSLVAVEWQQLML